MSLIVSSRVPGRLRRNALLPCCHFMPSRHGGAWSSQARNICLKSGQKEDCFCMPRITLQRHVLEDKLGQYHSTERRAHLYFHTHSLSLFHVHTNTQMYVQVHTCTHTHTHWVFMLSIDGMHFIL